MIIGIGGASRSGKTRLAKEFQKQLGAKRVNIVQQDDYALPQLQIPKIQNVTDWEHPSSIDFEKFEKAIHNSNENFELTIVEGFLIYYDPRIKSTFDVKIFLSIDEPTFLKRKVNDERWGKMPVFYIDHIWKSFLKYGKIEISEVDYYLDSNSDKLPALQLSEIVKNHL